MAKAQKELTGQQHISRKHQPFSNASHAGNTEAQATQLGCSSRCSAEDLQWTAVPSSSSVIGSCSRESVLSILGRRGAPERADGRCC